MFKLVLVLQPRSGISPADFHPAWLARRRALADQPDGAIRRLALRHAYNEGLPQQGERCPTGHDWETRWIVVEELWFADEATLRQAAADVACNPLLADNEWADPQGSQVVLAREAPNAGAAHSDAPCKSFLFIRRQPQLTQEQFNHHWTVVHPPVWAMVRKMTGHLTPPKTVKTYLDESLNGGKRPLGYDGIAEGWHNSVEEMAAPFQTPEHDLHVLADADLFREVTRDLLAREHLLHER